MDILKDLMSSLWNFNREHESENKTLNSCARGTIDYDDKSVRWNHWWKHKIKYCIIACHMEKIVFLKFLSCTAKMDAVNFYLINEVVDMNTRQYN